MEYCAIWCTNHEQTIHNIRNRHMLILLILLLIALKSNMVMSLEVISDCMVRRNFLIDANIAAT